MRKIIVEGEQVLEDATYFKPCPWCDLEDMTYHAALMEGLCRESQKREMHWVDTNIELTEKIEQLKRYFTSANPIPVERATILARDFWQIIGEEQP
jgi:hypothetical protein